MCEKGYFCICNRVFLTILKITVSIIYVIRRLRMACFHFKYYIIKVSEVVIHYFCCKKNFKLDFPSPACTKYRQPYIDIAALKVTYVTENNSCSSNIKAYNELNFL